MRDARGAKAKLVHCCVAPVTLLQMCRQPQMDTVMTQLCVTLSLLLCFAAIIVMHLHVACIHSKRKVDMGTRTYLTGS
jgi:hypothetical protein